MKLTNHTPIIPPSTESADASVNNDQSINNDIIDRSINNDINDDHSADIASETTTNNGDDTIICINSAILANDIIVNEFKDLSNNVNNVERLVKKLSMIDAAGSGSIDDHILRETVKIRPLVIDKESCQEIERNEEKEVYYRRFSKEDDLQPVIDLITKDLSEPYSIYTYRYFIYNWPRMCIMAFGLDGRCVGAIVGKTEAHASTERVRGYIAMLAVQKDYRRRLIGSRLVELVIDTMIDDGCSEVVLETEITNKSALSLYEKLGFIRDKRLFRYYLNGVDAFRLKLWLS